MNAFNLLRADLAKLTKRKGILLSVIAVLLVPIVYAGILLSATWSPYDNLSNLPVAVVNKDKGGMSGDEPINVGEDLVASMKESMTLGFQFVSEEKAQKGLENQDYYMVIEIPEDFSEKITTVLDENPQIPELRYIQNEGLNFMASQVTNSATERIREQLGNQITETYAKNLFSQLGEIANGFKSAADGSEQIHSGSEELHEGTSTMVDSLEEKAPDIDKLAAGAEELEAGTGELLSNLTGKKGDIAKLAAGAKAANDGAGEILSNLKGKSGDIAALAKGSKDLEAGTKELLTNLTVKQPDITRLAEGAAAADAGTATLLSKLNESSKNIETLAAGSKDLSAGVQSLLDKVTAGSDGITELHQGALALEQSGPRLKGGAELVLGGLQSVQKSIDDKILPGVRGLNAGVGGLRDGVGELSEGSKRLAEGLEAYSKHPLLAADPLFAELVQGSKDLENGINNVITGIDTALKPGVEALEKGIFEPDKPETLKNGIAALVAGQTQLSTSINNELIPGFTRLAEGTTQLDASWSTMLEQIPVMNEGAKSIAGGNHTVNVGWKELTAGVSDLKEGTTQISAGTADVNTGWKALTSGATELNAGSKQIAAGNQTVNTGWQTLTGGVTQLQAGTSQIAVGNATVNTGWQQLSAGASKLHAGMKQVSDGTQTVKTGWGDLTDGATQINDGVGKIKDGSGELNSGLSDGAEKTGGINATDTNISMFSSPVKTVGEKVNGYQYYRDSTAPYIISLALFVGMLIMSFVVDFKKPADVPVSKVSWFASKYMKLSIFAITQALLVSIFALLFLKLQVGSAFSFILFTIFVSMTFMTIIFFLVALGGNIGRFAALTFIVLQLSITGANLPIEMLPENLRNLSQFLPLTYSNAGFKSIISLNDSGFMWSNLGVLFIYFAIFAVLALGVFLFNGKKVVEE
ncbi:YhgE/Pip family protein [Fredinandcohnia sp. 179-A 10B2 NHS]|uniref:YhgE/Pip family protein n=1 Tax=Fredinandcohnia sp. 179-A 10B2 NHS TaxID=3235176 RepID=UPI0039A1AB6D